MDCAKVHPKFRVSSLSVLLDSAATVTFPPRLWRKIPQSNLCLVVSPVLWDLEYCCVKNVCNCPPPFQFVIQVRVQVLSWLHVCPLPVPSTPQELAFMKFSIKIVKYRVPSLSAVRTLIIYRVHGLIGEIQMCLGKCH